MYLRVVPSLLTSDETLLDAAPAGYGARAPTSDDPPTQKQWSNLTFHEPDSVFAGKESARIKSKRVFHNFFNRIKRHSLKEVKHVFLERKKNRLSKNRLSYYRAQLTLSLSLLNRVTGCKHTK